MSASSHSAINASLINGREAKSPVNSKINFTIDEKLQARLTEYTISNPCKLKLNSGTLTIAEITAEYNALSDIINDQELCHLTENNESEFCDSEFKSGFTKNFEIIQNYEKIIADQKPSRTPTSNRKKAKIKQKPLSIEDRTLLEEYKAALLHAVQTHLHDHYSDKKAAQIAAENEQQKSKGKTALMWVYFGTLMVLEFLPMIIGNLMYATESFEALLPYLPFIVPNPILLAVGIGCVFNSVFGAICFVGPRLLDALGIKYQQKEQALAKAYRDQVSAARKINESLLSHNNIASSEYKSYQELALNINDDIQRLKHHYPTYNERTSSKLFTQSMSAFIGLQAICSSLYLSAKIVGLIINPTLSIAAVIAIMPWTIFLLAIPFTLAFFKVAQKLRINSASSALDPAVGQHQIAKSAVDEFKCEDEKFEKIYNAKVENETNATLAKLAPLRFTDRVYAKVISNLRTKVADKTQVIADQTDRLKENKEVIAEKNQEIMKLRRETSSLFSLSRKLADKSPTHTDATSPSASIEISA